MSTALATKAEVLGHLADPPPLPVLLREFRDSLEAQRVALDFALEHMKGMERKWETITKLVENPS